MSTSDSRGPNPELVEHAKHSLNKLADENATTTNSEVRYMAYGSRLQTALRASHRYLAYTSDLGEAFRPIVPPSLVTVAYGVSWLYLAGDVSYETYKSHRRGPSSLERAARMTEATRLSLAAVERATFQAVASMALPALTIHTVVAQTSKALKNAKSPRVRRWAPTATGLAVVPFLPFLFDHSVETASEKLFTWIRVRWASIDGSTTGI